jgi:hypothetical protein
MATLYVNDEAWSAITEQEQAEVIKRLHESGALAPEDTIEGSKDVPKVDAKARLEEVANLRSTECAIACGMAAGGGGAACTGLAPAAFEACVFAALAAYEKCMEYCDG